MTKTIPLGFEVETGERVNIPLRHLAVTGQTQESGKTTTLEALIARSGLRAVTFVTKRGEGSFTGARRIAPYFRDQGDWQYVAAILEASRGEKLKFERSWIIRASKGARTLADVHNNVRAALQKKATGKDADVYTCLDAYLEIVVPEIARVEWAPTLALQPGVNAMDLGALPVEMQHLVIRSALNWVLEHERDTVVVVPEAWKFIPQGRGTPVKLAAEAFVRQGAALGNYLWLDSQDLGGIDKTILRSIVVWLLGVQREANEIKRTLDNVHPGGTARPRPVEIAQLALGRFYACWGREMVKTYVQPAWMDPMVARDVALGRFGDATPSSRSQVRRFEATAGPRTETVPHDMEEFDPATGMRQRAPRAEEDPSMCQEHQRLQEELAALRGRHETLVGDARGRETSLNRALERIKVMEAQQEGLEALRRGLAFLMPSGAGGDPVDLARLSDAVVERVLARIPPGGAGGPITVTPPEKLRADFQREEVTRILDAVAALPALAKTVLRLLEAIEGATITQTVVAQRLGRSTSGGSLQTLAETVKALVAAGFVEVNPNKKGIRAATRAKIAADLSTYQATDADVEAVYQNVLHALATNGAEAAA